VSQLIKFMSFFYTENRAN